MTKLLVGLMWICSQINYLVPIGESRVDRITSMPLSRESFSDNCIRA